MKSRIIAFGERTPAWADTAVREYLQRLPRQFAVELRVLPLSRRSDVHALERQRMQEDSKMRAEIRAEEFVIALDEHGKQWTTAEFAKQIAQWQSDARQCCILIGGPEGLGPQSRQRANVHLALSSMTMPHALARVVVAEQWYRAWSLQAGHPYHRE
ncbi:MAG: 23S rRNA (pseudouridine(1915)-N(3))-methyltransferase RlmH [Pseudomonadales bacterium]